MVGDDGMEEGKGGGKGESKGERQRSLCTYSSMGRVSPSLTSLSPKPEVPPQGLPRRQ